MMFNSPRFSQECFQSGYREKASARSAPALQHFSKKKALPASQGIFILSNHTNSIGNIEKKWLRSN
jgi:hypothetical protein